MFKVSPLLVKANVCAISRHFSKARSQLRRAAAAAKKSQPVVEVEDTTPKFSNMIRQLYRRSHPDLLRASHLEYSKVNDESMQVLNSVLTSIKTYGEYPPQIIRSIPFYMKTSGIDEVKPVDLVIRTAGGDCKKQITKTFADFFVTAGISNDGVFVWDREYFPTKTVKEAEQLQAEEAEAKAQREYYEKMAEK